MAEFISDSNGFTAMINTREAQELSLECPLHLDM